MEIAAFILSIISFVATVIFSIYEILNALKVNDINLEAELSKEVVKEYLTNKIPNAVSNISFDKNKLSEIGELQETLNSFRRELRFYQYCDKTFYDDFKKSAQDIEEYKVSNEGKQYEPTELAGVNQDIVLKVKKLYDVCQNKYKRG